MFRDTYRLISLLVLFQVLSSHPAAAQTSTLDIGGLAEVSTNNAFPYDRVLLTGSSGQIRALNDVALSSIVLTDPGSVSRFSAVAGKTLSLYVHTFGTASTVYFGSATDTGNINFSGWYGNGSQRLNLVLDGGTLTDLLVPRPDAFQQTFTTALRQARSLTINNNATLYLSSAPGRINNLQGGGSISIIAPLSIGGGTFSTSITGASRLTFTGDTTWTGVGASIGTLEVRPGVTLTTTDPNLVETSTDLQIDGTHQLGSDLAVNGLSGSGLIALSPSARLTVGSQNATSNFGGTISGNAAGLTKAGTGVLTLSGNSSYTGETIVDGGTLQMGVADALPSASNVRLNAGLWSLGAFNQTVASLTGNNAASVDLGSATLTLGGGTNTGFFGSVTGTGGLTKIGANSQDLYGLNSYSGPTTISGGTLRIALGGSLPNSRTITVNSGGDFDLAATNALSPQSRVTLNGTGARLRINADQSIGSLDGSTGSQLLFGTGRTLTIGGANADSSFAGNLGADGNGSLVKSGTGRLSLTGTNSYTGATTIAAGTLIVNGSIAASSGVAVGAGATLGGSGTVPGTTVTGGTLSPGNSPGTLTINGDLTMDAASTYRAEIQGPVADRINVSGTASLAGTLRLIPLGGSYSFNSPYTLLSAAGGRSGTFGTIDETGAFGDGVTTAVNYTGREVQLTLTPKPLVPIVTDPAGGQPGGSAPGGSAPGATQPSPSPGANGPANAVAGAAAIDGAIARGADASPLFAIYDRPAAAIPAAVNQLSGEVHTSLPAIATSAAGQFLGTMLDSGLAGRLALGRAGPAGAAFSGGAGKGTDRATSPAFLDQPLYAVWGASYGSAGRVDGSARIGSAGRDVDDAHLAVGADMRLGANSLAGVAVSGGRARASLSGGLGKVESDVFQAGLYGMTRLGPFDLAAAGGYGRLDTDVSRAVPLLGNSLVSSAVGTVWSGRLQASMALAQWGGFTLSPLAALQAVSLRSPTITERAGFGTNAAALAVPGGRSVTSRSELGAQIDGQMMVAGVPLSGFLRASWAHYLQRDADITAGLTALPGTLFVTRGARPDANAALIAAGLDARLGERVTLGVRLDGEFSANTRRLGGSAQLRMSF